MDQVLKAMVELANSTAACVTARFNGTTLTANPGDDYVVLAAAWWEEAEAAHEAWKQRQLETGVIAGRSTRQLHFLDQT